MKNQRGRMNRKGKDCKIIMRRKLETWRIRGNKKTTIIFPKLKTFKRRILMKLKELEMSMKPEQRRIALKGNWISDLIKNKFKFSKNVGWRISWPNKKRRLIKLLQIFKNKWKRKEINKQI